MIKVDVIPIHSPNIFKGEDFGTIMPIEVCGIGGYTKVGGNSIAVKIDEEVIILDMGLSMENYIHYSEDREDVKSKTYEELVKVDAVPDYRVIKDWKEKVKAIVPGHGHLDHIGAIPFAAPLFPQAKIVCTPYTAEVIRTITSDEQIELPNKIIAINLNSTYKVSDKITLEFVNITHSIPHASIVTIHTPYGKILYAIDYKLDMHPTLGSKPNLERLEELGDEGVILLIIECLYAQEHRKMPSEAVAKQMLKDVLHGVNSKDKVIVVTTFSSHIARLKSIIEMGQKLNRKIVFLGRSLAKYVEAAQRVGIVDFKDSITLIKQRDKLEKMLHKIQKEKGKYLIVCTGHQGEPKAILARMVKKDFDFSLDDGDIVVFSCSVIPVEINKNNRDKLDEALKARNVRLFTDVHVSGHAAREDHRDMIEMVKPKHIIPAHAGAAKAEMMRELAAQLGYKNTHILMDGKRIMVK